MFLRLWCWFLPELERFASWEERIAMMRRVSSRLFNWDVSILVTSILLYMFISPSTSDAWGTYSSCMFWVLIGLAALLTVRLCLRRSFLRALRIKLCNKGYPTCVNCGYDLRALSTTTCPECGRTTEGTPPES